MIDIFLSRPTDISDNQQQGLDNLLTLLKFAGLNPRTLGATDYPQEIPLNEIVQILQSCSGMIVLGYSKIIIEKGSVKGENITEPIKLASEWNQIEAALAYASQMPLLIICDKGVSFGFFDRGAANCFVHQVDFSNSGWSFQKSIQGAIQKWKERVVLYKEKQNEAIKNVDNPKRKLLSLKHDFIEFLDRKIYNKKNKQSKYPNFDYSTALLDSGIESSLSEFLHKHVDTLYDQNMKKSGNRTLNEVLNELNNMFPEVYEKLVELFNKDAFNKEDLDTCFDV